MQYEQGFSLNSDSHGMIKYATDIAVHCIGATSCVQQHHRTIGF